MQDFSNDGSGTFLGVAILKIAAILKMDMETESLKLYSDDIHKKSFLSI